jgi:hypothetical protein
MSISGKPRVYRNRGISMMRKLWAAGQRPEPQAGGRWAYRLFCKADGTGGRLTILSDKLCAEFGL